MNSTLLLLTTDEMREKAVDDSDSREEDTSDYEMRSELIN